jgi:hypothetical protein
MSLPPRGVKAIMLLRKQQDQDVHKPFNRAKTKIKGGVFNNGQMEKRSTGSSLDHIRLRRRNLVDVEDPAIFNRPGTLVTGAYSGRTGVKDILECSKQTQPPPPSLFRIAVENTACR